jgi:hypothetical protein
MWSLFFAVRRNVISWDRYHRPAPVPPGFGKAQTHARNDRRRKKRLLERVVKATPPVPGGSPNAIPLGAAKLHVDTPEPMMMSLKNKNKRRGFKNTASVPSRVTFQDDDIVALSQPQRLIPPSERDQLPPRLFVTSVDVEAGMWPKDDEQKWDRKQKKIQRDAYGHTEEQVDFKLDYGKIPEEEGTTTASDLDYAALEKAWMTAPVLGITSALSIGFIVGWQVRHISASYEGNSLSSSIGTWRQPCNAHPRDTVISCPCSFE